MTAVGVYGRHVRTETVHIVTDERWPMLDTSDMEHPARTLCGKAVDDLDDGDETASGIAATCRTCRKLFRTLATEGDPGRGLPVSR